MKTAGEIAKFVGGTLKGNPDQEIYTVGSLERADTGALAYAEPNYLDRVSSTGASCVLIPSGNFPEQTVIIVENPRLAFAKASKELIQNEIPFQGVHPEALVHKNATLDPNVSVGAWTYIESDVQIGRGTVVFPGCYIGPRCRIGPDCVIYPHVVLYPGVEIGARAVIHAGVVLGADGFGFVFDGTQHIKIPQVGHLKIGADVEIGANTCVDRGTLDETMIAEGAKVDNLCQIAHNVNIGTHAIISSQTGIAGSSRVGNHAIIGGQVGIADYCRIDNHALVGAQCGIPSRKRIPAGEVYWGTPARPLKDIKVQQAHVGRLPKMAEEIKRLRAEVNELKTKLVGPQQET